MFSVPISVTGKRKEKNPGADKGLAELDYSLPISFKSNNTLTN